MADRVKGITIEIGGNTTGLNKALASTNKEIKDTQNELKIVERGLKMDPTNITLLEQKQRLLTQSIGETKTKLDTLKTAEKQVQDQMAKGGKVSQQQYDALQREIFFTEHSLRKAEQAAKDVGDAIKRGNIDDELKKAERAAENLAEEIKNSNIDDELKKGKKAAEGLDDALDDAKDSASSFGDVFSATAMVEGIKGVASALGEVTQETAEYRRIMASLEVSSQNAGYSAEETATSYRTLYGVLADDQTAATTTANLQALGLSQGDLTTLIDGTIGAWARYGDSIPIDGLAESINETVKTATVTGTFADVLNWAGTSEDSFNEKLQAANSESERANIIMDELAKQGLAEAGQAWRDNNEDIVAANQAQADFQENAAKLGERISPIVTAIKDGFADLLGKILELTEDVDFSKVSSGISSAFGFLADNIIPVVIDFISFLIDNKEVVLSLLAGIGAGLAALKLAEFINNAMNLNSVVSAISLNFPKLGSAISALSTPVFLVAAAVVALVTLIATKGDEIQAILQKVDDFLQNIFAADWTESFGAFGNVLNAFFANVKNIWDAIKKIFDGIIDFIRGVFTGDWERAWSGVKQIFSGIFDALVSIAKAPINGIIGILNAAIDGINMLIGGINKISFDVPKWVPGLGGKKFGFDIKKLGKISYLANGGVLSQGSAVVGEAGPEILTMLANGKAQVTPLTDGQKQSALNSVNGPLILIDNFNNYSDQDIDRLTDMLSVQMQQKMERRGLVWG